MRVAEKAVAPVSSEPVPIEPVPSEIGADLEQAARALSGASQVALACHVSPDGDALGSMLGFHHMLVAAGRQSVASFSTPFVVAPHYRQIPGIDLLTPPGEFPSEPEVMVTFDSGSITRLGDLEPSARAARELIVVDHHISNTRYGSINVIDPSAAASSVIAYKLAKAAGLELNRDAAVCLFAALVCDTGRFQYESTTAEVFELARELLTFDVPVASLTRSLFEEHRFAYLGLMAEVLGRAKLVPSKSFVWAAVTKADLSRHGVTIEETEGLIDLVRRTAEADVSCMLKEDDGGAVRVSLRSLGGVDVSALAAKFGGGGHKFAAGFTSDDPIDIVVEKIEQLL